MENVMSEHKKADWGDELEKWEERYGNGTTGFLQTEKRRSRKEIAKVSL